MSADKTPESEKSQSSAVDSGVVPLVGKKMLFNLDHGSPAWDLLQYTQRMSSPGQAHADKVVPSVTHRGK